MSLALGITLTAIMGGIFVGYALGMMFTLDKFEGMLMTNASEKSD